MKINHILRNFLVALVNKPQCPEIRIMRNHFVSMNLLKTTSLDMTRSYKVKLFCFLSLFLAVMLLGGCGKNDSGTSQEHESVQLEAEDERDYNSITIRPELIGRIKIGSPSMVDLADRIQVPSRIEIDEERTSHIGSYVTGRIINLYVVLGDSVKAGDPLVRITSPELSQAQLAYLRALSRAQLTQKAFERAHHLLAADVIPLAEVERRESELEIATAELEAATDQLKLLGMDRAQLAKLSKEWKVLHSVDLKSNRDGIVISRNVIVGQVVQPADPLFQVADLSYVWAVGEVPEQVARTVSVGQHVDINVPAIGDVEYDGVIIFVADTINPLTRTVMVRVMVENSERKLKPDMLANMHIKESQRKTLVIPEAAVVRDSNRDYVFLAKTADHFQRIPVELGPEIADFRPVLDGLTIDQNIVIEGAFHLDSERKLAELE